MASISEDINEALLKDVLSIYSDAEDKMLKAVAKRIAKGIKTEGWNEAKLKDTQILKKEIEGVLKSTDKKSKAIVSKGILESYKQGVDNVTTKKGTHNTILDSLNVPMNLKMQILATNGLLDNASFQVLRNANDAYQQVMAQSTTGLLAGTDTRIQASQKMLNNFASKGITSFVDKAGRHWDLSSYAEMCARTVSAHAALQGHIDRQLEVGEDLVRVSSIGTTCPICMRWQSVVLSISGNNPKYHSVAEAKASGLFHPNCKHTLVMYVPELDDGTEHEGKVEPMSQEEANKQYGVQRNKLIEKQRANERKIRYWKKRKALAITPKEEMICKDKIKYWQYTNMLHCEKNSLRRQYAREGVRQGNENGPKGAFIGGNLEEFDSFFSDVVGESPKKVFKKLKMNLQLFADDKVSYEKWLKDEILSLDQLDIDKAQMKDASNKAVTPTYLYKKYIGDEPGQDYSGVSEYEKGTKEYKSGYAKWLKQQIEEIGVSYKVKPQYTEVHEDIPTEDKKLSATEIYKKYHEGEKPVDAYKKLGGEGVLGMSYGKWVETQKKELIKNGITKTVPFGNTTTQKTVNTISNATKTIADAKDAVSKVKTANSTTEAKVDDLYKKFIDSSSTDKLKKYKEQLDTDITGVFSSSQAIKAAWTEYEMSKGDALMFGSAKKGSTASDILQDAQFKYEIAKLKNLEMIDKSIKEGKVTQSDIDKKVAELDVALKTVKKGTPYELHLKDQKALYKKSKTIHKLVKEKYDMFFPGEYESDMEFIAQEKLHLIQEAEAKKQQLGTKFSDDEVINMCKNMSQTYEESKWANKFDKALKEMGCNETLKKGSHGTCYFDIHDYVTSKKQKAIDDMTVWQAVGDYTSGSRPHNFAFKTNESAEGYFQMKSRYTREQAQQIAKKLDKAFEVNSAVFENDVVLRHGNTEDGLIGLLGTDDDFETFSHSKFVDKLKALNNVAETQGTVILNETGFLSTSPSASGGFTKKPVEVRIVCPKGARGLYVDNYSYYGGEEEVIVQRGRNYRFVKAYSRSLDEDEFKKVQSEMSGSGKTYSTDTIIFLEMLD